MITKNNYLEANYKEHLIQNWSRFKHANNFFQKTFRDENNDIKYFINIYYYLFENPCSTVEIFFYEDLYKQIEVTFSDTNFETIEDMEKYVESFFKRNNFINNPHN